MCPKAPDSAGLHRSSADQEVPKLGEAGGLEHRMPARGQVMALLRGDLEGSLVPPCQSSAISLASPLCGNQLPSIPSPWRPPTPLGPTDLTTPSLQGDSGRFGFPPFCMYKNASTEYDQCHHGTGRKTGGNLKTKRPEVWQGGVGKLL